MATEYKKYLATEILNEERTVSLNKSLKRQDKVLILFQITYRLLSRAMKVHVNVAKEWV